LLSHLDVKRCIPIVLLLALAPAALGQGLPDLAGDWRLSGDRVGGRVRIARDADGYRYEREVRQDRDPRARVERGRVVSKGAALLFEAEPHEGLVDLGKQLGPVEPARMRYRPAGEALEGERLESGRLSRERLERWSARDGNAVELLIDGEHYARMRQLITDAKEEIEVQTFHWADDEVGRGFARQLVEKVRQGVRVRVLIDASSKTVHDLMKKKDVSAGLDDEMRAGGVEVIIAHGYLSAIGGSFKNMGRSMMDGLKRLFGKKPPAREKRGIRNHDHRKLLIVDRRTALVGGQNISNEYEDDWHDVQAGVVGPAAFEVHAMFVERWNAACGKKDRRATVGAAPAFEAPAGDVRVELLGSLPGISNSIREYYEREIDGARERILIEMAYFLDDRIIDKLGAAARRGVRTVVIVPSDEKNDVYLIKEAFAWVHNDVVRSGVELYFYQPSLVHTKVGAFDGQRCTVGSSNLDKMALDDLAEANLVFHDARVTRELERRIFAVDLPKCERAVVRPMPWRRKIVSGGLHLMRSFL
jgi:cardiolipin synthase